MAEISSPSPYSRSPAPPPLAPASFLLYDLLASPLGLASSRLFTRSHLQPSRSSARVRALLDGRPSPICRAPLLVPVLYPLLPATRCSLAPYLTRFWRCSPATDLISSRCSSPAANTRPSSQQMMSAPRRLMHLFHSSSLQAVLQALHIFCAPSSPPVAYASSCSPFLGGTDL